MWSAGREVPEHPRIFARLADTMAERESFGIAEMLLNQFQRRGGR